jgi:hypothetical protein
MTLAQTGIEVIGPTFATLLTKTTFRQTLRNIRPRRVALTLL